MVWLPGWSTGSEVWRQELERWPAARHVTVEFATCESTEEIQARAGEAVAAAGEAAVVVGWSLGAMAALEATRHAGADETRLCLVAATGRFVREGNGSAGWPPAVLRRMQRRLGDDAAGVLRSFDRQLFAPGELGGGAGDAWAREHGDRRPSAHALHAGLEFLLGFSLYPGAEDVRAPVFLLHGEEDEICPHESAVELASALPRAALTSIARAGHAPFWTRPDEVHAWLRSVV
jgi:pimeloyl-[acyl-carrier protein] methyl ester esterase